MVFASFKSSTYVVIMFALLVSFGSARLWMLRQGESLQPGDLIVQRCEVLFDDIRQLGNLNRPVVEKRLSLGHCSS